MHSALRLLLLLGALACVDDADRYASPRVEGRTAAVADGASLFALRLWTAPELDSLGRAGVRVDSLAVEPLELRLSDGDRLPLSRISVTALDSLGQTVPAAPIVLEADSGILALTPELLVARGPGRATLRVRCLLPNGAGSAEERTIAVLIER